MTNKVAECSLCKHEFPIDNLIDIRKEKHEARHQRDPYRNSSRESGGGNNVIGKVEWKIKEE